MTVLDVNSAITILRDIYWVGFYDDKSDLHCNSYLSLANIHKCWFLRRTPPVNMEIPVNYALTDG